MTNFAIWAARQDSTKNVGPPVPLFFAFFFECWLHFFLESRPISTGSPTSQIWNVGCIFCGISTGSPTCQIYYFDYMFCGFLLFLLDPLVSQPLAHHGAILIWSPSILDPIKKTV